MNPAVLMDPTEWTTGALVLAFALAAGVIGLAGTKMAGLADRLADRTGLGEALMGGLFLGISTSLPGISASLTAALDGFAAIAASNALGGIAVQTAFLAIADIFHRRANLEHAAASVTNMIHVAVLVALISIVIVGISLPAGLAVGHVDVTTLILVGAYLLGLRVAYLGDRRPMWHPRRTPLTVTDEPGEDAHDRSLLALWAGFALVAVLVMVSGVVIARCGGALVARTGISGSVMGGLFMAVSTSLPELVTTIAAVRRGALILAVADIAGGNAFDVLFICMADIGFTGGSLYQAAGREVALLGGLAVLLNSLLLLGLLRREQHGPANIGFESIAILVAYVAGFAGLAFLG